jgi:hypothetical protein
VMSPMLWKERLVKVINACSGNGRFKNDRTLDVLWRGCIPLSWEGDKFYLGKNLGHELAGLSCLALGFAIVLSLIVAPYFISMSMTASLLLIFNMLFIVGISIMTLSVTYGFNFLEYDKIKDEGRKKEKIEDFYKTLDTLIPAVIASIPMYFIAMGLWANGFAISVTTTLAAKAYFGITGFMSFMYQIISSVVSFVLLIISKMDFKRRFAVAGIVLFIISLVLLTLTLVSSIIAFGNVLSQLPSQS